jgi:hypothetical protein
MEARPMGYFAPTFENPYPSPGWAEIADFEYLTPLRLLRDAKAGPKRDGEDAEYVVSDDYCTNPNFLRPSCAGKFSPMRRCLEVV